MVDITLIRKGIIFDGDLLAYLHLVNTGYTGDLQSTVEVQHTLPEDHENLQIMSFLLWVAYGLQHFNLHSNFIDVCNVRAHLSVDICW